MIATVIPSTPQNDWNVQEAPHILGFDFEVLR
jgi:hypothetical protein